MRNAKRFCKKISRRKVRRKCKFSCKKGNYYRKVFDYDWSLT